MMEPERECTIDPSKYVVLDVETNGLSSIRDDLLSISLYKPDTGESYNRFLPLELYWEVVTTDINGIKTEDLQGLKPLSQKEVDDIIQRFELKKRIILTYGNLDERFLAKYFQRHHLQGIDYFAFYNFKHEIISSRYSEGNITKDNLCRLYGIENVQSIHSGSNDCILEWKLYEKMNGQRLLITDNNVFEFNNEYIIPASFISSYPNLKYYLPSLPKISCESQVVFSLKVSAEKLKKFPRIFNGMILEHLINSMLNAKIMHNERELLENKKKMKYLGKLPSAMDIVPMLFNPDGSLSATRPQDKALAEDINSEIKEMKTCLVPLVEYMRNEIFCGGVVKSQELVVYPDKKILAVCDLSNEHAVLEIKSTTRALIQEYAEQLYYEADGRKCYVLLKEWRLYPRELSYVIYEVDFTVKERTNTRLARFENAKNMIETEGIELVYFKDIKSPVRLRCKNCGNEWSMSFNLAKKQRPCPVCVPDYEPEKSKSKKTLSPEEEGMTKEERRVYYRYMRYKMKIERKSGHQITVLSYTSAKSPVKIQCLACGYEGEIRADRLLENPDCPICNKQ